MASATTKHRKTGAGTRAADTRTAGASRSGRKPAAPARKYHHGDLRRALIDAALALIAEGELGTLSLREVARRAGVTPAAPYHHFRDKAALLAAVAEEGFLALGARMDAALARVPAADVRGRLAALARAYVEFARAHQAHYRVMFLPDAMHGEVAEAEALHAAADATFDRLLATIEAAQPRGREAARADAIAARAVTVWATAHGFVSLWNDGLLDAKLPSGNPDAFLDTAIEEMVALAAGPRR